MLYPKCSCSLSHLHGSNINFKARYQHKNDTKKSVQEQCLEGLWKMTSKVIITSSSWIMGFMFQSLISATFLVKCSWATLCKCSLPVSPSYLPSVLCLFVLFINVLSLVHYSLCLCRLLPIFPNKSSIKVENFISLFTTVTIALGFRTFSGSYEPLMMHSTYTNISVD